MTKQPKHIEDDKVSFIDILLFLKTSVRNVITSSIVCLFIGAAYYFAMPKLYEVSATIQMATVAREAIEKPDVLLEKIKLPLFFSAPTLQACGSDGDLSSNKNFAEKLKPTLNQSAPHISFSAQARSTQEARGCLNAVISEIQKSQNELAKPLIEQKKQKIVQLSDQLKIAEGMDMSFPTTKYNNLTDTQVSARILAMTFSLARDTEIRNLRSTINALEVDLIPPNTQPLSFVEAIYAPEISNNKRPIFTLGLSLALGVFFGLLITGVLRLVTEIRRQMRDTEKKMPDNSPNPPSSK